MSTCVYPIGRTDGVCGKPVQRALKLVIADRHLSGKYCGKHLEDVIGALVLLGMEMSARTNRKRRALYTADSGATFSMAEAREWLVEQGVRPSVSQAGRVSKEELAAYAAAH